MYPWWNDEDADPTINFRFATYEVWDMVVHIGNRPYKSTIGGVTCNQDFLSSIDAWISVTDTPTLLPPKTNYLWFPWWEPEAPPEATVKCFILALNQIQDRGHQTVYIHCDAGSHRSPSMFGFWLKSNNISSIKRAGSVGYHNPDEISDPFERAESYFQSNPEIKKWCTE